MIQMRTANTDHLFLIDGSGFIFRAFYALPTLTSPQGTPVNAVLGFSNMLVKLLRDIKVEKAIVCFDAKRRNFRMDIYEHYKATRKETPEELIPQFPLIREACRAFNVPTLDMEGYEADDLIATLTRQAIEQGQEVTIVSSDKDLTQLLRAGVHLYDPMKSKEITAQDVQEKFGVQPEQMVELQALAGDFSDNIPGIPGIGPKTAAKLIQEFGSVEGLLANLDRLPPSKQKEKIEANQELARISKKLVQLDNHVVMTNVPSSEIQPPDPQILQEFLAAQGFKSLLRRMLPEAPAIELPKPVMTKAPTAYLCIQTLNQLKKWISEATHQGVVGFDTETTSLLPEQARLVGFSLALGAGRAAYVPLQHRTAELQIPLDEALALLRPLLADPSVLKVGHHIKYDMRVLQKYKAPIVGYDDTILMSYLLHPQDHGMDALAQKLLLHSTISYEEVTHKKKLTFDDVSLEAATAYAAEDADITLRLRELLKPELRTHKLLSIYETLDRPLVQVLAKLEQCGVKIDAGALEAFSRDLTQALGELERKIYALAKCEFNIGSPKQLGEVLFGSLGLTPPKKSKTGAYSTGADVLEGLAMQGHEIAEYLLTWRQLTKLRGTYTDALVQHIDPITQRIHTAFSQTITLTGRLSSSNPNLQNIPIRTPEGQRIRQAFVAEPGNVLLSFDYSQIELRLLAHIANMDSLKEAFHNKVDIHALTASQIFGIPLAQVDATIRRQAKAVNFGIIYGISGFGLARQLKISQRDAQDYIRRYKEQYPGIGDYMDSAKAFARAHGYVETLLGRRCYVAGIASKNPNERSFAERQAINAPLQGTAADLIKLAMIRIDEALQKELPSCKMILQVHDELVFEVPEADAERAKALIRPLMENVHKLSVPLEVGVGQGTNWNVAH